MVQLVVRSQTIEPYFPIKLMSKLIILRMYSSVMTPKIKIKSHIPIIRID